MSCCPFIRSFTDKFIGYQYIVNISVGYAINSSQSAKCVKRLRQLSSVIFLTNLPPGAYTVF
jgi:hypothetical protein